MSPKTFVVVSILTVVALGAAVLAPGLNQGYQPAAGAGDRVFPKLIDRANDIAAVVIEHAKGRITLIKNDNGWTMNERDGYAARQVRVQRAILGLSQLRLWEPKTKAKEKFAKLELQNLEAEGAKSRKIQLFDTGGAVLAELIVGKRRPNLAGTTTGGVYVRKPDIDQTWLAAGTTDASKDRNNWLERKIVNIGFSRVKNIVIRHPDGETVNISKPTEKAEDFKIDNMPAGKKLISQAELGSAGRALNNFQLNDVRKDDTPFDAAATVTTDFTTFDGLSIKTMVAKQDGAYWLKVQASGTAGEATEKAAAITARTKGWAYQISEYAASNLTKRFKDLVEDAKAGS
ncbi:MAG TPA: DUF4340 domain-containing protein [Rhodospirillales bacterium]|nr:DUF4340 domain-containing protein [Rhodospirillales bacterium]